MKELGVRTESVDVSSVMVEDVDSVPRLRLYINNKNIEDFNGYDRNVASVDQWVRSKLVSY